MLLQPGDSTTFITNLTVGTKVQVLYSSLGWSLIRTGSFQGYVSNSALGNSWDTGAGYGTLYNPSGLHVPIFATVGMFEIPIGSYPNGTQVRVIQLGPEWALVEVSGTAPPVIGYVSRSHLNYSGGTTYTTAVVNNPNPRDFLNLRAAPTRSSASIGRYYNGTIVEILQYGPEWCYVRVNGIIGYMMTYYLSFSGSVTPPGGIYSYATVNTVSSRLNLRAAPTTSSRSLGLFPRGTIVTVLTYGPDWCRVQVGGLTGHMATRYLAFGSSGGGGGGGILRTALVINAGVSGVSLTDNLGRVLGVYYNGAVVQIIEPGISRHFVQIGGIRGYMSASNLQPM